MIDPMWTNAKMAHVTLVLTTMAAIVQKLLWPKWIMLTQFFNMYIVIGYTNY
jgi:hypothetical protein